MSLRAIRSLAAPADFLARLAHARAASRFYWRSADRALELLALGEVAAVEASGPGRLQAAAARVAELLEKVWVEGDGPASAGPLCVGGFGFWDDSAGESAWRGFPPLRFWLPALLFARVGDTVWCTVTRDDASRSCAGAERAAEPALGTGSAARSGFSACAEPSRDEFARAVSRATAAIGAGELEKVVLARACTLTQAGGFDAARVLRSLGESQPGCTVYGVGLGGATFLGASPERLVGRRGSAVHADALAGSAPRGRTPDEDARRGQSLLESPKEREEHAIVRRAVVAALGERCSDVRAAEAPELLRLEGIQHLHTPVSGRLADGERTSVLSLAGALFPTPAVGGAPRAAALAFLRRHEAARRGWYSGGVGWLAPSGEGELCVALRSALLRGDAATLHAGVGIVAGSTPEAELDETRWKLASALGALVEL